MHYSPEERGNCPKNATLQEASKRRNASPIYGVDTYSILLMRFSYNGVPEVKLKIKGCGHSRAHTIRY